MPFIDHRWVQISDKRKSRGQVIIRNFFMAALLVLFSINGVASAAEEDDIFEIEAEGSYQMVAGVSIELVKKWPYSPQKDRQWIWREDTFHVKALLESKN